MTPSLRIRFDSGVYRRPGDKICVSAIDVSMRCWSLFQLLEVTLDTSFLSNGTLRILRSDQIGGSDSLTGSLMLQYMVLTKTV